MAIISILNIGFSLVVAILFFIAYVFFFKNVNKSWFAIISCAVLLCGLSLIQLEHLDFFLINTDPLGAIYYRFLLFLLPPMFYFFSKAILFPESTFKIYHLIHLAPLISVFFLIREIAIPAAFLLGTGYCLWLCHLIYSLRSHRNKFQIEFFFFGFFAVLAVTVLIFGFSVTYIDNAYFYYFYTNGIGLAFILINGALIVFPNLLEDLTEVVKLNYSNSTLGKVDLSATLEKLENLMKNTKVYQDENLSLSTLAESMDLTSHQLSELINTQFNVSFSKFIREQRVEAAKILLKNEPDSSILAISLETGFKSQSNFYAAFKEIAGQSPGSYRKVTNNPSLVP